jgi:hypothetical protein
MAKNAVDAHRKLMRKKEVKKNKDDRKKAREVAVVKKDTRCRPFGAPLLTLATLGADRSVSSY